MITKFNWGSCHSAKLSLQHQNKSVDDFIKESRPAYRHLLTPSVRTLGNAASLDFATLDDCIQDAVTPECWTELQELTDIFNDPQDFFQNEAVYFHYLSLDEPAN